MTDAKTRKLARILSIRTGVVFLAALLAAFMPRAARAQTEQNLTLKLSRDWGYGFGGDIQGLFGLHAEGPADLVRVVFYIDDQVIGEAVEAPFRSQFNTAGYSLGSHILFALGTTSGGVELRSNEIQRNFVPESEGNQVALWIVLPAFVLVFGAIGIFLLMAMFQKTSAVPYGAQRTYGISGGAICKNCQRPFAMRFLALNLGFGTLDRCPHCGKWGVHRTSSLAELRAAEAEELAQANAQPDVGGLSDEEKLKKALDDSRFQ